MSENSPFTEEELAKVWDKHMMKELLWFFVLSPSFDYRRARMQAQNLNQKQLAWVYFQLQALGFNKLHGELTNKDWEHAIALAPSLLEIEREAEAIWEKKS